MYIKLAGRKEGMTRLFDEEGNATPVTVISFEIHYVCQIKTVETDGYNAIQLTTGHKKPNRLSKTLAGHFAKAGVPAGDRIWECKVDNPQDYRIGQQITVSIFKDVDKVDVAANSKGKGFAGTVKRWNFSMQNATHGNSLSHRAPGSIGQNQTPGRVFKGKKMAGHLGNERTTILGLKVLRVDEDKNLIIVKGAIPGYSGCTVTLRPAVKAQAKAKVNRKAITRARA